ncbi:ABC transporter ATP-binding protein/permease [Iodidimonas sp. SYSU 1G8]|uniref:ABCB family ABC transporter ATP-binding protein/permease n=1 Tax=Iodidimonas sp. SYSU 1G8 TaxID=3133967 RepID=UPI0031FE6200
MSSAPQHRAPHGRHHWKTVKTLLPYLWPRGETTMKARVVAALVLLAAAKAITVSIPLVYKAVVAALTGQDAVPGGDAFAVPVLLIVGYGIARLLSPAFGELRDMIFANVGQQALRRVALRVFRHLHGLSLRFHLDRRTGGLSRVIERGTQGVDFVLRFMIFNIIPTILEIFFVAGMMWGVLDWRYAAATVASIAAYVIFTFAITEWRLRLRREMNLQDTEANTKAIDSLLNYETVKYFNNEEHEAQRFDKAMRRYERAAVLNQSSLSGLNIGQNAIIAAGLMAVMIMSAFDMAAGRHGIDDFVFVNMLLAQLFMPLGFLGFVYREMRQSLIDMEAMFDLMEQPREVEDKPGADVLVVGDGEIVFDRVSFGYKPDRQILFDVSFTVPAGAKLAIVGHSGAGKSTISRLLYRFYDVTGGAIRIDGQNIAEVTQDSLRAAIGIVPQDTVLFNDTIGYNIGYGRPSAPFEQVEEAARLAAIHDFITSLPQGYDTNVGERGLKVSGGEKQRIAIARTIMKDPPILVLDEATSALDTNTEKDIQEALKSVSRNRTTLVIAHRLSTVVDADEIVVLEHGRIVERGTHTALLALPEGSYATMWQRQQEAVAAAEKLETLAADY